MFAWGQVYNMTAPSGVPASSLSGLAAQPCPPNPTAATMRPCLALMVPLVKSAYVTLGTVAFVTALLQVCVLGGNRGG